MTTLICTSLTNEDVGYVFSQWDEELPDFLINEDGSPNMGDIFRDARSEWGRCTSSVYNETKDGTKKVGWYFLSRQEYEDWNCHDTYIRGAWITLKDGEV